MGFYTSSTIIEDAKRKGLVVLPVDVTISDWDCEIGDTPLFSKRGHSVPLRPVRIGLRYVKGLSETVARRILDARAERAFASIDDVVRRAKLDDGATTRLAESGAFAVFEKNRRGALWAGKRSSVMRAQSSESRAQLRTDESVATFTDLDLFESIGWDYATMNLSAAGHPLEPLRDAMRAKRLPDAGEVTPDARRRRTHYAGLVICRQRPGTASGVVFLTMEDETGFVNVVVWSKVYEEFRVLVKTASFLGVTGRLQVEDGVTHLIAERFWRPKLETKPVEVGSRDFH